MKKRSVESMHNLILLGHGSSGKTMLAEAMLYSAKAIERFGKVDDGNSTMDYDPEEIKRKISISTAIAPLEYREDKINLIDTPGFFDFVGEVKGALRAADVACIVVCAVSGLEVGTDKAWGYAEEQQLPRVFFINKMDRENANFDKVLQDLRESFGSNIIPIKIPVGAADKFEGVIDVLENKFYCFEGGKINIKSVPEAFETKVAECNQVITEAVVETDDTLLSKYLEGEAINREELAVATRKAIAAGSVVPVLTGSALKVIGIQSLLDTVIDYMPSPVDRGAVVGKDGVKRLPSETEPFSALVFKTMADPFVGKLTTFRVVSGTIKSDSQVYNSTRDVMERIGQLFIIKGKTQEPVEQLIAGDVGGVAKLQNTFTGDTLCVKEQTIIYPGIEFPHTKFSLAVEPKDKGDENKIGSGLARLMEEDPTFKVEKDKVTNELIASGMGDLHIEVITSKLQKKFGVGVVLKDPKITYKETIKGTVKVEGKHKKQSGGRGQYGHVWIEMSPLPSGGGFEFVDNTFGGSVPKNFIPAVEKGIKEIMERGVLSGNPVVDVRVSLYDGSFHSVDSSEMAFKIAASLAFKKGFMEAKPILLEPVMQIQVTVPEEFMGDIIGDLNKKRGKILGMEPAGKNQIVKALAPQAELGKYAIELRSMTQGRADFELAFDHFEEVPPHQVEAIIAAAKKDKTDEEE